MTLYHIVWTIDLEADGPKQSAEKAREIAEREAGAMALLDVYEATGYERAPYEYLCGIDLNAREEEGELPYVCRCGEHYAEPVSIQVCLANGCCDIDK
jgi:hypothetical protein